MPVLNVARRDHASCAIGRAIFVFCGTAGGYSQSLNTIERLSLSSKKSLHWQLIRTPVTTLSPRFQPAVAQINEYEVVILGGWSNEEH